MEKYYCKINNEYSNIYNLLLTKNIQNLALSVKVNSSIHFQEDNNGSSFIFDKIR